MVILCTLIAVLVAVILFPLFAQSKTSGPYRFPGRFKEVALGVLMYANDYDNFLPDCPVDGISTESYVLIAKLQPYIKNTMAAQIDDAYPMGAAQHQKHDVPPELGGGFDMTPPNDPCVGLPASKYGYTDSATSHYFGDVYAPSDFGLNPILWGYVQHGCPPGGTTDGYSHPGANIVKGLHLSPAAGRNSGVNWLGPGVVNIVDPARVILFYEMPMDNGLWPGPSFWTAKTPRSTDGLLVTAFLDGHLHATRPNQLLAGEPGSVDRSTYPYRGNIVTEQNWNPPYDGHTPAYGRAFYWWGTQLANPAIR